MNIVFKGIKTGAEIWEIIKHPKLNESDWDKDKEYEFIQYDKTTKDGLIYSETKHIVTEQELIEQSNQQRISELKQIISDKKLLDEDATSEQNELKSLMSDTHDEYLESVKNEAIDTYTLELIEGGYLT